MKPFPKVVEVEVAAEEVAAGVVVEVVEEKVRRRREVAVALEALEGVSNSNITVSRLSNKYHLKSSIYRLPAYMAGDSS